MQSERAEARATKESILAPSGSGRTRILRYKDVDDSVREPLLALLRALKGAGADGVEFDHWDAIVHETGVDAATLRDAVELYAPRQGRIYLTARGANVLAAAAPVRGVEVRVLPHALERAEQRRLLSGVPRSKAREVIQSQVRAGLQNGRRSGTKPTWLKLYGQRRHDKTLQQGRFYVWPEEETHAWLVARDEQVYVVLSGIRRSVIPVGDEDA